MPGPVLVHGVEVTVRRGRHRRNGHEFRLSRRVRSIFSLWHLVQIDQICSAKDRLWPKTTGRRTKTMSASRKVALSLGHFSDFQGVIDLDAKILDGAFQFRMAK